MLPKISSLSISPIILLSDDTILLSPNTKYLSCGISSQLQILFNVKSSELFEKRYWYDVNHLLVWHGRGYCSARKPDCNNCTINKYCNFYQKVKKEDLNTKNMM